MRKGILFLFALGFLCGCSTYTTVPRLVPTQQETWISRSQTLQELEHWRLRARLLFRAHHETWTATLIWTQNNERYDLRLLGPLGQGGARVDGDQKVARVTTQDGASHVVSPERLVFKENGALLNMQGLVYWVRGLSNPDDQITHIALDNTGRLRELEQAGWRIQILQYGQFSGMELPVQISFLHDTLSATLWVSAWEIPPS